MPGFSRLYSSILFSTSGVATCFTEFNVEELKKVNKSNKQKRERIKIEKEEADLIRSPVLFHVIVDYLVQQEPQKWQANVLI